MMNEDNEKSLVQEVPLPGDTLRKAREELGYSMSDIANRLRLRLSIIEDIENNHFEGDAIATFIRGYVRSYAKYVGLNEFDVLNQLDVLGKAQQQDIEMQSFSKRTKREAHDNNIMKLTWVVGLIIVGLSGTWWWQNTQLHSAPIDPIALTALDPKAPIESTASVPLTEVVASVTHQDNVQVVEKSGKVKGLDSTHLSEQSSELASNLSLAPPKTASLNDSGAPATLAMAETPQNLNQALSEGLSSPSNTNKSPEKTILTSDIAMTFSGDCWVEVRDLKGRKLEAGLKKAGDVVSVNGDGPFKIVLGAPVVVKMSYKGEPVDLTRYRKGKVARFKWPQ